MDTLDPRMVVEYQRPEGARGTEPPSPPGVCHVCGYSLEGLPPRSRCPECDSSQATLEARRNAAMRIGSLCVLRVLLLAWVAAPLALFCSDERVWSGLIAAAGLAGPVAAGYGWWRMLHAREGTAVPAGLVLTVAQWAGVAVLLAAAGVAGAGAGIPGLLLWAALWAVGLTRDCSGAIALKHVATPYRGLARTVCVLVPVLIAIAAWIGCVCLGLLAGFAVLLGGGPAAPDGPWAALSLLLMAIWTLATLPTAGAIYWRTRYAR